MTTIRETAPLGILDYLQLAGVLLAVIALRELGTWPRWSAETVLLLGAAAVGGAVVLAVWAWRRRSPPEAAAPRLADTPQRPRARRRVGTDATRRGRRIRLSLFSPVSEEGPRRRAGPPGGDTSPAREP